jgi:transcription elongation factor GreA-like protein
VKSPLSSAPSGGSAAFFALLSPALSSITSRLVELQEAQHMLVTTVSVQRSEGIVGASDWTASRDICDAIPLYIAKLQKIKKTMATAQAMVQRTERASDNLRRKLEEREKERIAKRRADASGYSSVSAK